MLLNYLKIALRSLFKHRVYSFINILGLGVGLASVCLILLHVNFEYSYDNFQKNKDRIFKVTLERSYPTHKTYYDIIPHSFAQVMSNDFPEVEKSVRILGGGNNTTPVTIINEKEEKTTYDEKGVIWADSTFFDVFSFRLIKGEPHEVLQGANRVVLTKSIAKKYFGNSNPLGKVITSGQQEFKVSGVCEDPPENSHMKFTMIVSTASIPFLRTLNYMAFSAHTYLLLHSPSEAAELESKFPAMVKQYAASQIEQSLQTSYEDYTSAGNGYRYYLRPLTSIHLDPKNIEGKFEAGGNRTVVFILISIAVLILIIACINFMNLATARATERSKEVGVRKTLGSHKSQLIKQFLLESVVISLLSMVLAIILIAFFLPYFNELTGNHLGIDWFNSMIIPVMLIFTIFVGILAGTYPAFILSAFKPATVLKGTLVSASSSGFFRNGLVVFQFVVSIILIGGTLTVFKQLSYVQDRDLGFDKDHMLVVDKAFLLQDQVKTFRDEAAKLPGVLDCGIGSTVPGNFFFGFQFQPKGSEEVITTKAMSSNEDYDRVLSLNIIEGRGFSKDFDDSLSIIFNEATVKAFGTKNPVGSKILVNQINPPAKIPMTVIGVVKNFNFMSLKDEISPLVLVHNRSPFGFNFNFVLKLKGGEIQTAIQEVQKLWDQMAPGQTMQYSFLDTTFNDQYKSEQTSGKIFGIFAILAIIIACVGLFGLAAFTAGKRTKEIGIRKVLGASVANIILLLTIQFARLVVFAFIIAVPIIWYSMTNWLEVFAFRVNIGPETYLLSGLMAFTIAVFTVSYQSLRAALVNPTTTLGAE